MSRHRILTKSLTLILSALLITAILTAQSACAYSDVPNNAWYEKYVTMLSQFDVISGYSDGTFRPNDTIKRSEFLKMISIVGELYPSADTTGKHWAGAYWVRCYESEVLIVNSLKNGSVSQEPLFAYTFDELEKNITRYEMAVLINNVMSKVYMEPRVKVASPADGISDYWNIPDTYKDAVEQSYGKGVLTGFEDSSFRGTETLTRAQASAAVYRLLFGLDRTPAKFASAAEVIKVDIVSESFALRYATLSAAGRRRELFGNESKTYFYSASDAKGYMEDVTIPIWTIVNGSKQSSTATITVHKLVAAEVYAIFAEIYNDPEQFPIQAVSGARYTDALRHSWGCAIDINPTQNYYCRSVGGSTTAIVGTHWRPDTDQFSIKPNGSVVRAFAKYGWGWGGQGWSGGYYDYMHFSILSTGG